MDFEQGYRLLRQAWIESMELLVLNTVLNDIIGVSNAGNDVVMWLTGIQRKIQEQIAKHYREMLVAQ